MTLHQWVDYCMSKPGAEQDFPFDQYTVVMKVCGKIFSLAPTQRWEKGDHSINLKCDPAYATELREKYTSIIPGYHMNKKHWNTVDIGEGELDEKEVKSLIDHSYNLIIASLSKKDRNTCL